MWVGCMVAPCGQSSLHWLAILHIGVLRPGIFLLAFVRGLALVRVGESWETVPSKPKAPWVQIKTQRWKVKIR